MGSSDHDSPKQKPFYFICRPKDPSATKDDASYGGYHLSYEVKKLM